MATSSFDKEFELSQNQINKIEEYYKNNEIKILECIDENILETLKQNAEKLINILKNLKGEW